ncbi:tetratricopeptide repeat protein [Streptacidiphilus sp. N1-3]|uniref:Tetratricopeptide repeat protein n=1 Tax=Streptacidiphilus alkalitolerans TaxID=3342712 RepID=A0ABV6WYA8_9ACTN
MGGRVLGMVHISGVSGREVSGTTKAVSVFALLALSPDRSCSQAELFRCVWPGVRYDRVRLDRALSDLRGILGKSSVVTRSGTCQLRVPDEEIDLFRFRRAEEGARRLPPQAKFDALGLALEEWGEGEPLGDLPGPEFARHREELRQELFRAVQARCEAAYRAKQEKWLRAESEKWRSRLPGESWAFRYYLLAHAPLRSGARLVGEIQGWRDRHGSPDGELQRVIDHLTGNPVARPALLPFPPPNQLPARSRRAVGRDQELEELTEAVLRGRRLLGPAVIVVTGLAGIGKTLLVNQAAHQVRTDFPDGVLHAGLRGFAGAGMRQADTEEILDRFLAELSPDPTAVGVDAKSAALRSVLAERSVLILLDDARDAEQVAPLLPGDGSSVVVITSRRKLGQLRSRYPVHVQALQRLDDGAALEILQEGVAPADRPKYALPFAELARFCGGHPLALTVLARRLDGPLVAGMHALSWKLKEVQGRMDALDDEASEQSVQAVLQCSEEALSESGRRLLWQLATHPGPSISWQAVMDLGLAGGGDGADQALAVLLDANLVESRSGRYQLHDLVRAYALQRVRPVAEERQAEFEKETVTLILEHELQNIWACDRLLDNRRSLPIGEPDRVTVAEPEGLDDALSLLESEYETAVRCVELALEHGDDHYSWLLPTAMVTFQWRRNLSAARRGLTYACEAAERCAPNPYRAMVYRMLGGSHWNMGEYAQAEGCQRRAVRLSELDDTPESKLSLARSLHALGLTRRKQGEAQDAEQLHRRAAALHRELADVSGEAAALNAIGTLLCDWGEYEQALQLCMQAFEAVRGTSDQAGVGDVLYTLGVIRLSRGEQDMALTLFEEACDAYRAAGHRPGEEKVLLGYYADALLLAGRREEAVLVLERALVLRQLSGGSGVAEVRDRLEALR